MTEPRKPSPAKATAKSASGTKAPESAAAETPSMESTAAPSPKSSPEPKAAPAGAGEPIDAEFEPAETPLSKIARMQVSMPILLAVAAAASVLGGVFGVVFDGSGAGRANSAQLQADVDARLAGFDDRLRALRGTIANVGGEGGGVAAAIIGDLEAELASVRDQVTLATSRLAVMETANGNGEAAAEIAAQLAGIETRVADATRMAEEALVAPNAQAAEIASIATRINALSEAVRAQGRAIDQLSTSTSVLARHVTGVRAPSGFAASGAAAALSFASLQDAALSGRPFATEFASADEYFSESPDMIALGEFAETGAPTPADLAASFRAVASAARDAERPQGGGFVDRLGRMVTGLVTVRRLDAPATDSAADVVVRAQRRISNNDLSGAADEFDRLNGASAEAVSQWVAEARARVEIEDRLEALRQSFSES